MLHKLFLKEKKAFVLVSLAKARLSRFLRKIQPVFFIKIRNELNVRWFFFKARQVEPHYKLEFINYPKFPLSEKQFKEETEQLAIYLMTNLKQNRIVTVYHNETKMFEKQKI